MPDILDLTYFCIAIIEIDFVLFILINICLMNLKRSLRFTSERTHQELAGLHSKQISKVPGMEIFHNIYKCSCKALNCLRDWAYISKRLAK